MLQSTHAVALALALATAPLAIQATAAAPASFPLTSTSVELPSSDRAFPNGPGVDVVSTNCVTCHSAGMILNQPALSRTAWEGEVHKMVTVYKAPVSDQDAATIINYLATTKGPK